jgi:hypothetical protein
MKAKMKTANNILWIITAIAIGSCNEGIDPISKVEPGPDEAAPTVVINKPSLPKIIIPFTDEKTNLDVEFDVVDDIEIKTITVSLDGTSIGTYDSFKDYRRAKNLQVYENLPIGHHTIEVTATDVSNKTTTKTFDFEISNIYEAKYAGEIFYMPFEGGVFKNLIGNKDATVVGAPGFVEGKFGSAYAGAANAYLRVPTTGLLGPEFSATFWYKANATPDRSGILTISAPPANPGDNNLKYGFRFFREGSASNQTFKLNAGFGTDGKWVDGGPAASLNPATAGWAHMAFTISPTKCVVYINGVIAKEEAFAGIDWTGVDMLSIASGAPHFVAWDHKSDLSLYDELRLYNKALTQEEVTATME